MVLTIAALVIQILLIKQILSFSKVDAHVSQKNDKKIINNLPQKKLAKAPTFDINRLEKSDTLVEEAIVKKPKILAVLDGDYIEPIEDKQEKNDSIEHKESTTSNITENIEKKVIVSSREILESNSEDTTPKLEVIEHSVIQQAEIMTENKLLDEIVIQVEKQPHDSTHVFSNEPQIQENLVTPAEQQNFETAKPVDIEEREEKQAKTVSVESVTLQQLVSEPEQNTVQKTKLAVEENKKKSSFLDANQSQAKSNLVFQHSYQFKVVKKQIVENDQLVTKKVLEKVNHIPQVEKPIPFTAPTVAHEKKPVAQTLDLEESSGLTQNEDQEATILPTDQAMIETQDLKQVIGSEKELEQALQKPAKPIIHAVVSEKVQVKNDSQPPTQAENIIEVEENPTLEKNQEQIAIQTSVSIINAKETLEESVRPAKPIIHAVVSENSQIEQDQQQQAQVEHELTENSILHAEVQLKNIIRPTTVVNNSHIAEQQNSQQITEVQNLEQIQDLSSTDDLTAQKKENLEKIENTTAQPQLQIVAEEIILPASLLNLAPVIDQSESERIKSIVPTVAHFDEVPVVTRDTAYNSKIVTKRLVAAPEQDAALDVKLNTESYTLIGLDKILLSNNVIKPIDIDESVQLEEKQILEVTPIQEQPLTELDCLDSDLSITEHAMVMIENEQLPEVISASEPSCIDQIAEPIPLVRQEIPTPHQAIVIPIHQAEENERIVFFSGVYADDQHMNNTQQKITLPADKLVVRDRTQLTLNNAAQPITVDHEVQLLSRAVEELAATVQVKKLQDEQAKQFRDLESGISDTEIWKTYQKIFSSYK